MNSRRWLVFMSLLGQIFRKKETPHSEGAHHIDSILASIQEVVIIVDATGKIVSANPMIEVMTGYPAFGFVGNNLQEALMLKCENCDLPNFFKKALEGWQAMELPQELAILHADGREISVAGTIVPLYDNNGKYDGAVLALRDLTKELSAKRRQYEFLSFVSHQLRQPFGTLRWGLEILEEEKSKLSQHHQETLDDLYQTVLRFMKLIRDLVDISRLEEGTVEMKREKVDIGEVIQEVIHDLRGLTQSQNISINLFPNTPAHSTFLVQGDKDRLQDVFSNLITNAVRYNQPRGTVTIEAQYVNSGAIRKLAHQSQGGIAMEEYLQRVIPDQSQPNPLLLVSVSDTGLGIPEKEQPHIFQSFFRASNVQSKGLTGTGLGLFIVKSIVEKLDGRIFFTSSEKEGTHFYVVLLRHRE